MTGGRILVVVLVAGGAGFGGGMLAQALRSAPQAARADAQPGERTLAPRADGVARERIDTLARRLDGRLDELEKRSSVGRVSDGAGGADVGGQQTDGDAPGGRADLANRSAPGPVADLVTELASRPYTHRRSERLFGHLARKHGEIASTIARLKKALAKDPDNPHLHAALGTALTAKTAFATAPGPEQGTVWREAEKSFQKAIELKPDHWEARYSLAFGDSMAPEFVGLRPRAIKRFEALIELQEQQAHADDHALAYMRLGTLYKDAGNARKARAVWDRGRQRHPKSEPLGQALKLIGKADNDD